MRNLGFLIALGLCGASLAYSAPEPAGLDPVTTDRIIHDALQVWDVPGLAIAIVNPTQTLWLKAYGVRNLASAEPMTVDTVFPLASCSKAFTSAVLAQLVSERRVDWDDRVSRHWPWFELSDPLACRDVTFRDLLSHRTGLASHDYLWYRAPWNLEQAIRKTSRLPLEKPFRTAFQYQSVMYAAAAFAAEKSSGLSWEAMVETRLFKPLSMTHSFCRTPRESASLVRAIPHRKRPGRALQPIKEYVQSEPNPAGSIYSTARDLGHWVQMLLGRGEFQGQRVVAERALRETMSPQILLKKEGLTEAANPQTVQLSYGMGWVIQDYRGHRLVSHAGAIDGFRAQITLLPDERWGFAFLLNRHQSRMNLALSNTLVDRWLGLPNLDWNQFFLKMVDRETAEKQATQAAFESLRTNRGPNQERDFYLGRYTHPAYGVIEVEAAGEGMTWKWSGFSGTLRHHHDEVFTVEDDNLAENVIEFQGMAQKSARELRFLNLQFTRQK